jgi:hypothetical protein
MKKLALQKVVTLVAALALGSACIPNDALARGGGGSGFSGGGGGGTGGGGFGGGHMGGFPGGRMGGDVHTGQSGGNGLRDGHELGSISTPFFYGNYGDNAHGFDCWKSQRIPTNAAWRQRQAGSGTCY